MFGRFTVVLLSYILVTWGFTVPAMAGASLWVTFVTGPASLALSAWWYRRTPPRTKGARALLNKKRSKFLAQRPRKRLARPKRAKRLKPAASEP